MAAIPVVGPFIAPFVGLFGALFGQSKHSKCAHNSADRLTYLKCAGKNASNVPANQSVEWDPKQCGWYKWGTCMGAHAGIPPPAGCGPCCKGTKVGPCLTESPEGCATAATAASGLPGSISEIPTWGWIAGGLALVAVVVMAER